MRILALCDSPAVRPGTAPTGFARVARNLFSEWQAIDPSIEIDIWGIGFEGWGYRDLPWRIFPGGNRDWNSAARLNAFLQVLSTGGYTHVWMLMNSEALCVGEGERSFPNQLRACCRKHGIKSVLYFPIDCDHQELEWMETVRAVDVAVTFTEYGAGVVKKTLGQSLFPVHVLPHGLDGNFVPADETEPRSGRQKAESRKQIVLENGKPFASEGDFLILNVNKNEWRKDILRSLEILKGLVDKGLPAKLILRMEPMGPLNGVHIHRAAAQLGLEDGKHYVQLDAVPEEHLPKLYHAADLYLTTTMGEGWGLGITEALGCGVPVAMPMHTSCGEIGGRVRRETEGLVDLEPESGFVCGNDTRLRQRVDLDAAVDVIKKIHAQPGEVMGSLHGPRLPDSVRDWLSWKRIAGEFLKLMSE